MLELYEVLEVLLDCRERIRRERWMSDDGRKMLLLFLSAWKCLRKRLAMKCQREIKEQKDRKVHTSLLISASFSEHFESQEKQPGSQRCLQGQGEGL